MSAGSRVSISKTHISQERILEDENVPEEASVSKPSSVHDDKSKLHDLLSDILSNITED